MCLETFGTCFPGWILSALGLSDVLSVKGQSHAACSKDEIETSGFSLLGPGVFLGGEAPATGI